MRFPLLSWIILTAALVLPIRAQEPSLPSPETQETPAPLPVPPVPQLIPDDMLPAASTQPNAPSLPQLDEAFKDNPISAAAAEQRARIEWRKLRNVTANDTAVKAAYAKAEAARTDLEKRKLLRRYYEILFGKMMARASTPEMRKYLSDRKNEHLNTLPQPRVRPETAPTPAPAQPSPAPAAQAAPSPTPQPSSSPTPPVLPFATPTPATRP